MNNLKPTSRLHLGIAIIGLSVRLVLALNQSAPDPQKIIDRVRFTYEAINDYRVTAHVKVNIPNLRMPDKRIKILFKKPDRMSIQTNGFALVPKIGFIPILDTLLTNNTTVQFKNTIQENGKILHLLEFTPKQQPEDASITIWVDTQRWTIEKALLRLKDTGESVMNFSYRQIDGFWLPETTKVYIRIEHGIPMLNRPTIDSPVGSVDRSNLGNKEPMDGQVIIFFKDYRINRGIADYLFER
jgi:outer membrane lipoprotein-sorting protein